MPGPAASKGGTILRGRPGVEAFERARTSATMGVSDHGPGLRVGEDGSLALIPDGRRSWRPSSSSTGQARDRLIGGRRDHEPGYGRGG